MDNPLLIALSRQQALARQFDVIANNMANLRTTGYKGETLIFEEFLMPATDDAAASGSGSTASFVVEVGTFRDLSEGRFERTGNPLDVAISGPGWLVVETPDGERYTRDGALKIGPDGELVNNQGYPVLGEEGPILFTPDERDIVIGPDGAIASSGGEKGRLRLVTFDEEDLGLLQKVGGNLYDIDAAPEPAEDARLIQNMLEGSNVQPVVETARMIEVSRAYAATGMLLDQMHTLRRDAIDKLGSVPN